VPAVPHRNLVLVLAVVLCVAAACASGDDGPDPDELAGGGGSVDGPEAEPEASDPDETGGEDGSADAATNCRHDRLDADPLVMLADADAGDLADRVAGVTHACAPVAVAAPPDDPWAATMAAPVARAADAPLLLASSLDDDVLTSTLATLSAERLLTLGVAPAASDDGANAVEITELMNSDGPDTDDDTASDGVQRVQAAVRVADHLGTARFLAVDTEDEEARAAALARLDPDVAILPLPVEELVSAAEQLPVDGVVEVLSSSAGQAERLADALIEAGIDARVHEQDGDLWPPGERTTWLVDPADGSSTAVGAVAAAGRGDALLPIDATDPRSDRERTMRVREAGADAGTERHVLLGDLDGDASWQLETVLEGEALPWGGFRLFEDERMVALYGSVETEVLGALGEQGLDATVDRLRTVAEPYGADGARVLPAFELITTIASASAEPTGDYSRRTSIDLLRPWIDRAAEEELYVMLDLQPGRTDFLTQAQEYEELLLEPHVGLALDPEWRLEPDQVHLQQIGSVEAAEVQEVADWLAELTREHQLPEKLLVLHQFRFSMLPDRDTIEAPDELAMVVHMDGQGPIGTKYETYDAITSGAEDRWLWGWKNFYDEDAPTPTPEQVLDLDPLPVFVSYQ
jgi:hypothetical protein